LFSTWLFPITSHNCLHCWFDDAISFVSRDADDPAGIPTSIIDTLVFGTIIYWFVGLAYNKGASIANYFVFLLLMLVTSTSAGLIFSIIGAVVKDKTTGQACMSVCIVVLVLFSGFTVQADIIPK
jgi:hypothetical protein